MNRAVRASARVCAQEPTSIWLDMAPVPGCERCARGEGCGGGIFHQLVRRGGGRLRVPVVGEQFQVGELVWLEVDDTALSHLSLWVWGLPLLGMLLVAVTWASLSGLPAALISIGIGLIVIALHRYGLRNSTLPLRVRRTSTLSADAEQASACL